MSVGQTFSQRTVRAGRSAFTLIEILVVMAIIALLIAVLVPAIGYAKKVAKRSANTGILSALQTGLTQYYNDFRTYPASHDAAPPFNLNPYGGNISTGRGSAMLAEGLMGYLPGDVDGAGPSVMNAAPYSSDPRFGFRARQALFGNPPLPQGKIYGPYASDDPKTYKVNYDLSGTPGRHDQVFLDAYGNEILYYLSTGNANPVKVFDASATNDSYFFDDDNLNTMDNTGTVSTRKGLDGSTVLKPSLLANQGFFLTLGVTGPGIPDPPAVTTPSPYNTLGSGSSYLTGTMLGKDSYILASAGDDGVYFTNPSAALWQDTANKICDDLIVSKP